LEVTIIERRVEGETLACGTGVTTSANTYYLSKCWQVDKFEVSLKEKGGIL
jgi:diaminopimelate epimerase